MECMYNMVHTSLLKDLVTEGLLSALVRPMLHLHRHIREPDWSLRLIEWEANRSQVSGLP